MTCIGIIRFRFLYSNSAVGLGHRPVYVRVADAPAAEQGIRRKDGNTVAGYSSNVLLCTVT